MKGWKTIAFNAVSGLLLIASSQGAELWGLSPEILSITGVVGNIVLRFLTSTPVGKAK